MKMKLSMAALLCAASLAHAQTPPATRAEVTQLFDTVEKSQCKFNRNGSWHDAKSARKHLQDKFDYLDKKNLLTSTESFIAQGASSSSSSGKAYQIFCPGGQAMPSATWLLAELARVRAQK